ncbi:MAG: hypothetical protein B7Y90_11090 [Alphaproteobacteria bacterium 32-64-14]|nr:MAG: hypothetical protein B7Y90_11090 [Alphaproteobacteria bacterium 32-64-14]
MNRWTRILLGGASALVLMAATPAIAQEAGAQQTVQTGPSADDPQEQGRGVVVVFGCAEEQIGGATPSEGVVGYADLSTRPISRAAEFVEVIPGMITTEHSSGGKANQYFLRDFNLDHGAGFGGFIDLNLLMTGLVERVEFWKGVQYAKNGDYTSAVSSTPPIRRPSC